MNEKINFSEPILDVIEKRKSIRSYKKTQLTSEDRNRIQNLMQHVKGPFNSEIRFMLVESQTAAKDDNVKLGTYGVIKGATNFIVAAVKKECMCLEDLGYKLETIILYATSLDLGTCWLGGTFKKSDFAKAIDLREDEMIPIISPIGYIDDSMHILGSIIRVVAGSKKRKKWDELFFCESFDRPLSESKAEMFKIPLEMVRLAPSASNKQPWRLVKKGNQVHFYLKHDMEYSKALGYDIQRVDMGIAMCHFELSAAEMGLCGSWVCKNPNLSLPSDNFEYIISWKQE
ncbi:nitroreductase family protein [Clostridium thermarum]|uniref:nitroreductase family protein n=1 Tax=Clostridium thermarum TaxID=1716543 RepID=UPI0013D661B3|nr:nitroreductase family protein [Clostridium thermarum]